MLITREIPKGIDAMIQRFQTKLHEKLLTTWGIASDKYRCYGRCYRNKTDDGYIAENYEGSGEYKEVYWDDSLAAISFFGIASELSQVIVTKTTAHLVFFVDLVKLKPAIAHRADSEVRTDVIDAIGMGMYGLTVESVQLYIENVLREYPGSRRDGYLKYVDMHPVHCFRINLNLIHSKINC